MRCLIIVALAFMLSLPVAAQDFEKAEEAFERGDYATALRELRRLAEQGYAPAQNKLGDMYYFGFGVLSDNAEVVKWYRRAAEQGHRGGQYNLGGHCQIKNLAIIHSPTSCGKTQVICTFHAQAKYANST